MASDKKIVATAGREEIAGKRYCEIREIISVNSDMKFKDIINEIAGISSGSYYNYTSENSSKYGRISLFTVKNLSEFFDLSIGIFDCSEEFTKYAKDKISEIIRNKYSIKNISKNSSRLIEDEFINKLEHASKMEDKTIKEITQTALENYFIYPFMNKNHLINYFYLLEKYKYSKKKLNKKIDIKEKDHMEAYDISFMYCLAYDDLIMQFIRDGEIISFEKGIDFDKGIDFEWPNELEYLEQGITYPHFIEIVLSMYSNGIYQYNFDDYDCLTELKDFYGVLEAEESIVMSRSRYISRNKNEIKNIAWYRQLFELNKEDILMFPIEKYSIDDFMNSYVFNEYKSESKKMLYMLFDKMKSVGLNFYIQLSLNNTFTIYADNNVGNRLAIVSVYQNSIKITIMYDYNGYYCENVDEIDDYIIDKLIKKYNNQPKYKGMKFDMQNECFIET